jgi:Secretion system C-terminal sorting domain
MKFIQFTWVALLCLLCTANASAQLDSNKILDKQFSFHQFFDSVSAKGLITSRIPYEVLYDRVYPWSNLTNWDSYRYTCKKHLYQTWYDLEASSYIKPQGIYSFAQFKKVVNSYSSIIPIIVFDYKYAIIDSNAIADSTLSIDSFSKNYIDNNKPKTPYSERYAQLGGLFVDKVLLNQSLMLSLDKQFLLQNTGKKLCYVKIWNKTDNSITVINEGINKAIRFDKLGFKKLKMTFVFSDSSKFIARQKIQVLKTIKKTRALFNPVSFIVTSNILFQGYDEVEATTGYGDAHILYRYLPGSTTQTATTLNKPIVFLDGFDGLNKRQFEEIYYNKISTIKTKGDLAEKLRENGFDIVILNFPQLGSTNANLQIPDLGLISANNPLLIPTQVQNSLGQWVDRRNTNGDIINTDGGTDYIERNAMVFIRLMQELNIRLFAAGSSEKMVVVGPSMGGQISRYGLAYMEQKQFLNPTDPQWNHNCRLYMSFDSPNDGANISIGLQQTLNHLGNYLDAQAAKDAFETQIYSVAARQMLIEHMEGLNSTSDFFTKHHDGLNNNGFPGLNNNGLAGSHGYPMLCRKVALVNGSGDGVKTQSEGFKALYAHADANLLSSITTYAMDLHMRFMPSFGQTIKTFEVQNIKKTIKKGVYFINPYFPWTPVIAYDPFPPLIGPTGVLPTPLNMSGSCLYATVGIDNANFIHGTFKPFTEWTQYFNTQYTTTNNNSHGSMDVVPGGIIIDINDVAIPLIAQISDPAQGLINISHSYTDRHCFTPTVSCLGFKNNNFPWTDPVNNRNLLCNNGNELYFDGYYVQHGNEDHVSLTTASALWAFQEIKAGKNGSGCNFDPCISDRIYTIIGELNPCEGNQYTYTISPALPAGVNVDWSEFNDFATVGATSNSQATFKFTSIPKWIQSQQGFYIHASIINPCGANVILKIPVTAQKFPTQSDYSASPNGFGYDYVGPNYPNATYTWYNSDPSFQLPVPNVIVTNTNICPFGPYAWDGINDFHEIWLKISIPCLGNSQLFHHKFSFYPPKITHIKEHDVWEWDCSWGGFEYEDDHDHDGHWDDQDQGDQGGQDQGDQNDHDPHDDDYGGPRLSGNMATNNLLISISPNPANLFWNINFSKNIENEISYKLTDITGKLIISNNFIFNRNKTFQINNQNLSMGVYLLSIQIDDKIYKYKVIKN